MYDWPVHHALYTHKFTGKERDGESNLDNFGARYYTSQYGRFMSPDWAAKPTAVPYANFGNPQSLNLYSYVENNPTTTGDPDGHHCDVCDRVVEGADGVVGMAEASVEAFVAGSSEEITAGLSTALGAKAALDMAAGDMEFKGALSGDPDMRDKAATFQALISPAGAATFVVTGDKDAAKAVAGLSSAAGEVKLALEGPKAAAGVIEATEKNLEAVKGVKDLSELKSNVNTLGNTLINHLTPPPPPPLPPPPPQFPPNPAQGNGGDAVMPASRSVWVPDN